MARTGPHEDFRRFLEKHSGKKIAIATHNRADVDALSSAYALSKAIPGSVVCTSEEMNEGARMLAQRLGIEVLPMESLRKEDFEGLVVTDTSAYTLVPLARGWRILAIIDHHRSDGKDMQGELEIIETDSPSAAEIVASIVPEIDKDAAFALCVGIIADGARFKSARANTFETLARLMRIAGAEYPDLLSYAEPEPKEDSKIAVLSAMRRLEYVYAAGYVVATTEVGSNESEAASLISEAADVAFVAKWKDKEQETRISARARKGVKVPLNVVMGQVAKMLGGAGGGHPKAAGGALKAHTQEVLKMCVDTFISVAEKQG